VESVAAFERGSVERERRSERRARDGGQAGGRDQRARVVVAARGVERERRSKRRRRRRGRARMNSTALGNRVKRFKKPLMNRRQEFPAVIKSNQTVRQVL
jgi:hypothetical protein